MTLATPSGWRRMQPEDLADVARISDIVHADLTETPAVFAERLALFPAGCLVTEAGYAVAHPVARHAPPPLDTLLGALPEPADALHIHDVALLPHRRGAGLGQAVTGYFLDLARRLGLGHCTLVAIPGKSAYWARYGFAITELQVGSYGAGAMHMELRLDFPA